LLYYYDSTLLYKYTLSLHDALPIYLKDAEFVMQNINRNPDVTYSALVPNLKGAKRAAESNVDEINLLVSASNTHNLKNVGRTTRSEEHTSELQSRFDLVCRLLLEKK